MRWRWLTAAGVALAGLVAHGAPARAADKFYVYDLTTNVAFKHVYLAPAGTDKWGKDEAVSDEDGLDAGERLLLPGVKHGVFDVKLVDAKGRTCIKRGVDLTHEKTFDVRDADLEGCK